ncbi:M3 family metallopeptidase [Alterisphingorhabdus coralli]|uniref:M3 family metallopeptidase n=1 Tax=Alterisphingorhabdus coralli TaxID=3071408 RepID=A0AA97FBT2_9SPHN|nr:M3 family metallopeptidase [Parasphingorhabdus sp. SCSIO 66989]WOE76165.1 M3 family metallopeptidase [Parasphingorhabdus sp. SCSIO 66989]
MPKTSLKISASLLALVMTVPTAHAMEADSMEAAQQESATATTASAAIITEAWPGPFEGVPQWDKVTPDMFPAAFTDAMETLRTEFEAVASNPETPNFENTNKALELAGEQINRTYSMWGVHLSNLSNPEVRALQGEWGPKLSAFFGELQLDPRILKRYKAVYDNRENLGLNQQELRLVERDYDNLVRNGALLSDEDKARLIAINTELSKLYSNFSNKVLADEETFIYLDSEDDLAGLPDSFIASIRSAAEAQDKEGWALKNTRSVMQPFLANSTRRDLREQVYMAYINRGDNGDDNDTNATIAEILKYRVERAKLLGFETHAHYRMADTMAKDPERAMDLMMQVWPAAVARVKEEVADMQAIADAEGAGITIAPWDYRFYAEKVRKAKYDLDAAELKPYFQLDKLIDGMFDAAGRLYDLEFKENTGDIPVFHPDVRTFIVTDKRDGSNVGVFYMDNYARDGKRSGAWATTYRSQQSLGGERNVLSSNNNNFVKGGDGEPTLISVDDATTLFHEFGHALHSLLTDVTYPGLRGTPRDFVEYPSQVNENWLLTPYILNKYAVHYQTGEPIPQELVDKVEASSKFNEGFATVEYLSSAIVDMMLHNRDEAVTDVDAFERETLAEIGMPDEIVMRHRLPQFNHLFSSDSYSAGYYSYLWSETMDADTWAAFEQAADGVWDKGVADNFRKFLLSTGNETERVDAYRQFRGRDPDVRYIMKKRGFPVSEDSSAD